MSTRSLTRTGTLTSRRFRMRARVLATVIAAAALTASTTALPAAASETPCYGASCEGLDPAGRCDHDAQTVANMEVRDVIPGLGYVGQLELRFSPSCKANWGRFTDNAGVSSFFGQGVSGATIGLDALSVYNPGGKSQTSINSKIGLFSASKSTWTGMVDGTREACVAARVATWDAPSSFSGGSLGRTPTAPRPSKYNSGGYDSSGYGSTGGGGDPEAYNSTSRQPSGLDSIERSDWVWGPCV